MKTACVVWKESIYKRDFLCNVCDRELADKNGIPKDDLMYDPANNLLFCQNCGNLVGKVKEYDTKDLTHGKKGEWEGEL